MKLLVNISSILIMILSFSSITSAQGQQRPSQRSFATVLSKIKEKKNGREKMLRESPEPLNKEKVETPLPDGHTAQRMTPVASQVQSNQLPSRQEMKIPSRPIMPSGNKSGISTERNED